MKAERPSRTAHFVALGRAMADAGLSNVANFHDPTARVFLSDKGKRSLAKTVQADRDGKRGIGIRMARVMADTIALRTAAIDMAVRDAIASGATQLVILGAGYDGRAWRMPELAGVKVFRGRPSRYAGRQARACVGAPRRQGNRHLRVDRL